MNFFEKMFNRNPYPSDQIINFNIFAQLVGCMNWKCKHISIAVTDFPDMVHVELLSIPYDLLKIEKEVEALKKLGFDDFYQLINDIFKKGNIDPIDVEQFSRSKYDFNFLIIKFRAPNGTKEKAGAKYFDYSFIVRLCSKNNSPENNAFRMYYHKGFLSSYTLLFAKANWIGISATSSKGTKALIANLEKVMTAICAHTGIQLPNEIKKEQQVSYLAEKPLLSNFERAIN